MMISSACLNCSSKILLSRQFRSFIFPFSAFYKHTAAPLLSHRQVQSYYIRNCIIHHHEFNCTLSKCCNYSTDRKKDIPESPQKAEFNVTAETPAVKVSQRTKLKQAVRDYGATIIVFHIAISLASLGICYVAISNGVDAIRILTFLGFSESVISSKVAVGGSTFVIAYAVHKLFAPVRIGITLSVAPFIVRYLRKIKWLKPPKIKS